MRALASLLAITLTLTTPVPLLAAQTADEKELAAYVLTMPTLNKVMAAMRVMAQEMRKDPKYQQLMKFDADIEAVEKQLEPLQAKDETTPAEDKKIESLLEQVEKLREQKEQAEEAMSELVPMGNMRSLDDMERGMAKFPPMVRALKSQGLSPREYAKFMMVMLQAGMIYGFSQGKVDYAKLPAGVNPENIKFIIAHKAELDAMQKEFATLGKQQ